MIMQKGSVHVMTGRLMRTTLLTVLVVASTVLLMPLAAFAHVGVGETTGFSSGFVHPLAGVDHLVAMVAVGLWAAQMGGRKTWVLPCVFVAAMIFGGLLGMRGVALPFVEQGILASILVLGVLIAAALKLPLPAGAAVVAVFALFHGHAHGSEMPAGIGGAAYSTGFALATALLHATGIAAGLGFQRFALERVARAAGGVIAALGLLLAL